jgi:hypothetical protein
MKSTLRFSVLQHCLNYRSGFNVMLGIYLCFMMLEKYLITFCIRGFNFFLSLTSFYLPIVGADGYVCTKGNYATYKAVRGIVL